MVENEQALSAFEIPGNHPVLEFPKGLLFRAGVANVRSTGTAGFVLVVNHAVMDATSMMACRNDLQDVSAGSEKLRKAPFLLTRIIFIEY